MTTKIWKFALKRVRTQVLHLPKQAKILSIQRQNGDLCLWAEFWVRPLVVTEPRTIELIGTDQPMEDSVRQYLCTVQDGAFVWHVYEVD